MSTSVFDKRQSNDPLHLIRESMEIVRLEDGRTAAAFSTWSKRGVANHEIPLDEYNSFVTALEDMAENPPEPPEAPKTVEAKLRRSYKIVVPQDENGIPTGDAPYAQYKLTEGQGSKSCRIRLESLNDVVALLKSAEEGVMAAAERFEAAEDAERARKAEKEAQAAQEDPAAGLDAGAEDTGEDTGEE